MNISTHTIGGRYKEVCFHDFEDDDVYACSGVLDQDEAAELAWQLRALADKLSAPAEEDRSQILLPFVLNHAA